MAEAPKRAPSRSFFQDEHKRSESLELEDPMRGITGNLGTIGVWAIGVVIAWWIFVFTGIARELRDRVLFVFISSAVIAFVRLGFLKLWFDEFAPQRKPDVIYLRAFRNDSASWRVRVVMQEAIGLNRRLSGIRDPRRRSHGLLGGLALIATVLKYCTPRFMDLTAKEDWMARLWHTLQRSEFAVVDLADPTEFVLRELRLAVEAMGWDRVVLLGSSTQGPAEVRRIASQSLETNLDDLPLNILIWPGDGKSTLSSSAVSEFRTEFRSVAFGIFGSVDLRSSRPSPAWCGRMLPSSFTSSRLIKLFLVGNFAHSVYVGLSMLKGSTRSWSQVSVEILLTFYMLWNLLLYAYYVANSQRRKRAILVFFLICVIASLTAWSWWYRIEHHM